MELTEELIKRYPELKELREKKGWELTMSEMWNCCKEKYPREELQELTDFFANAIQTHLVRWGFTMLKDFKLKSEL